MTFNWNQAKAAGKHVASYAAGGVTVAVFYGFFSSGQGADLQSNINEISSGLEQVVKGIAGIAAILTPVYAAWRAAHNASSTSQGASLVASANSTNPAEAKVAQTAIVTAVIDANDLNLKGTIVAPMEVAAAVPSAKIVPKEGT